MEAAVGTAAGKIAPKLFDFLETNRKLRRELEHDIEYMKNEISMISAAIAADGDCPPWSNNQVHKAWIQMVRDLSHAMEDCIDRFTYRITLHPGASWIHRQYHRVKTVRTRNKFATTIRRLRKRSEDASKLRISYTTNNGDGSNTLESARAFDEEETNNTMATAAMGMDAPQAELMELIRETSHGQQPKELMVISLVGFGGLGKTFLAKHVYDTTEGEYEARAWVCAAKKGPRDVLTEILSQLGKHSTITSSGGSAGSSCHLRNSKLCKSLKECLGNKRFFIVIDDMQVAFWHEIKDAFPVVSRVSNIVMVTTAIHAVANTCSSAHGHVYVMKTLPEDHSRKLFFKEACWEDPPPPGDTQLGSEALKKCDGLPLALVTTARFLQSGGDPTREKWENMCKNFGTHLETNEILASMKRVLVHSYTSLGSQDIKTCLLYLGIYPSGHSIRRGSLIRRWSAEGIIKEGHQRSALSVAVDNFNELVNRSIIQPTDASSAEVNKCQTHGMMLEFILHKSMCENYITLLYDKDLLPGTNVRWLSVHNKIAARSKMNPKDLPLVRSLTVFGQAHKSVLDFSKYKLLRVLDLEECNEHLDEKHLKRICNMLLLRYLSLGGAVTVTVLPKEIKKLQFLETLDIRRTNIEILPAQVMELPYLVHLLGKFRLTQGLGGRRMHKLQTWLSENSKLETIAGFVGEKSQELAQLMGHMEHLKKVKIWCESTEDVSNNLSHLSEAIKGFIERGADLTTSLSLSLNFSGEQSQDLLNFSLENGKSYYLSSLKLQGNKLFILPPFITMLAGLTNLCLSFPHHQLSSDIIDALSRVRGLEFLKLTVTQLDKLIIGQGAFRSLRRLCIMVEVMTELEIQEGALPRLDFLWLLCKDPNGFSSTTIQSLPRLKEVTLYDGLSDEEKHKCKEAVKNHPRRPKLLFKLMGSKPAVGTSPAAITTHTISQEDVVESEPAESTAATVLDTITQENVVEGEPAENSESPAAPPTDMKLSMTMPLGAISAEESVQVVTSEIGSEPAAEIPMAPTTDITLSVTTLPGAISTGEPVQFVTFEMGCESVAETTPVATATDTMTQEVAVESEPVEKYESPVAPPTDMMLSVAMLPKAISNGKSGPATTDNMTLVNHNTFANAQQEYPIKVVAFKMGSEPAAEISVALSTTGNAVSVNHEDFGTAQQEHLVQVDGDGQYDDHGTEDVDSSRDSDDFASEYGQHTNTERFTGEMEDGTQAGEEQVTLEHEATRLVEAALGMLEKTKVRPEKGAAKDVVEAK